MTRVGQNPLKKLSPNLTPKSVTACTGVYIPHLEGYWAESLDILKLCLDSMRATTTVPFDLFVLDNGSCDPVKNFLLDLHDKGTIQFLLFARENLGKAGSWNILFPACPGKFIAYSDADILFRPGWLEETMKIFEHFDDVGMVTARPSRTPRRKTAALLSATHEYARTTENLTVETGDLIDRSILEEHVRSLGVDVDERLTQLSDEDVFLTRDGVAAYAYAGHYQFVIPKAVALQGLPLPSDKGLVEGESIFDERINTLGKLRLSTTIPLVRHLGNTIEQSDLVEFAGLATESTPSTSTGHVHAQHRFSLLSWLSRVPVFRRALRGLYLRLFDTLERR